MTTEGNKKWVENMHSRFEEDTRSSKMCREKRFRWKTKEESGQNVKDVNSNPESEKYIRAIILSRLQDLELW